MLVAEWDMATALEVEREEGYEKGLEKGRKEAAQNALAVVILEIRQDHIYILNYTGMELL